MFVLIMFTWMNGYNGGGVPVVNRQEFTSEASCEAARAELVKEMDAWQKGNIKAFCTPK